MSNLIERRNRFREAVPHLATASGSIASFQTDMKSALEEIKIHFNPVQSGTGTPSPTNIRPISGWTGLTLNQSGKNLFDINTLAVPNEITITDGIATGEMRSFFNNFFLNGSMFEWGKNERLYISAKAYRDNAQPTTYPGFTIYEVHTDGTERATVPFSNETATPTVLGGATSSSKITENLFIGYGSSPLATWHVSEIQIELGSQQTAFEPYKGNKIPVSWSSTYYGGYALPLTGAGAITYENYASLGNTTWVVENSTIGRVRAYWTIGAMPRIKYLGVLYCSHYKGVQKDDASQINDGEICVTNTQANPILRIVDSRFIGKTAEEVKSLLGGVQLVYENVHIHADFTAEDAQRNKQHLVIG